MSSLDWIQAEQTNKGFRQLFTFGRADCYKAKPKVPKARRLHSVLHNSTKARRPRLFSWFRSSHLLRCFFLFFQSLFGEKSERLVIGLEFSPMVDTSGWLLSRDGKESRRERNCTRIIQLLPALPASCLLL